MSCFKSPKRPERRIGLIPNLCDKFPTLHSKHEETNLGIRNDFWCASPIHHLYNLEAILTYLPAITEAIIEFRCGRSESFFATSGVFHQSVPHGCSLHVYIQYCTQLRGTLGIFIHSSGHLFTVENFAPKLPNPKQSCIGSIQLQLVFLPPSPRDLLPVFSVDVAVSP